ncbi:DUF6997 domain-containing protein [Sulfurimonas autotrophica]|uniref:DUF6997 domain-containing protein n=1 Tax=Sulfurimonas autotrophica (strain ATCC BAA-671 / DSM 16294 / JCM 11897 / OK10) TaxID=563040 RepID=E0URG1_SULAO|nr:hypothetical protein [Sulfurimonas autotrophica]ADN10047.1 hypothetical protein Saut_2004 [Sulfurimonas autotrophica DSM 16294]
MAKNDWIEVIEIFNTKSITYINDFLSSNDKFCPNSNHINIFDKNHNAFSSKLLNKPKPGNWIPLYKREDLSDYLVQNDLMPIRCGQGEFFFFKGNIFYNLDEVEFLKINLEYLTQIDTFIPLTLKDFHKNENAYLNKALAIGIINDFIDSDNITVFQQQLNYRRLLYGQFGKIKTNFELEFKTTFGIKKINKGFQFEIDLVLENEDEIIIFEAKQGLKSRKTFTLLQLYYPLIYLNKITNNKKKIRTIFIDIISHATKSEVYKLVEFNFIDLEFDNYKVIKSCQYY